MSYDPTATLTFPLGLMKSRGLIDLELHDAGMRFGALGWAIFGEPFAGCEALYLRIGGIIVDDRVSDHEPHEAERRRKARRDAYERMVSTLQRFDPVLKQPVESGRMRRVVLDVCRYAHTPGWLVALVEGVPYRVTDAIDRQLLMDGLARLAELERQAKARRAA